MNENENTPLNPDLNNVQIPQNQPDPNQIPQQPLPQGQPVQPNQNQVPQQPLPQGQPVQPNLNQVPQQPYNPGYPNQVPNNQQMPQGQPVQPNPNQVPQQPYNPGYPNQVPNNQQMPQGQPLQPYPNQVPQQPYNQGQNQPNFNGGKPPKGKWYNSLVLMWICLFILPPLGIVLLCINKRFTTVPKIILSIIFAFVFFVEIVLTLSVIGIVTAVNYFEDSNISSKIEDFLEDFNAVTDEGYTGDSEDDYSSDESENEYTPDETLDTFIFADDFYTLKEPAVLEDVTITATNVKDIKGVDVFTPAEGNVYVGIEFTIENISDKTISVNTVFNFDVYQNGMSNEFSLPAAIAMEDAIIDGTIAPGEKLVGYYPVEVSSDWQTIEIYYTESILGSTVTAFLITID